MIKELLEGNITQEEALRYNNSNVTYKSLPKGIRGFVFNYKGIYNIVINKNLSYYLRKKTIIHELAHIELSQLGQINGELFAFHIDEYEDEADFYISEIKKGLNESERKWCQ
jgi:Zn-dependent peptidase ImmA (M78 family)